MFCGWKTREKGHVLVHFGARIRAAHLETRERMDPARCFAYWRLQGPARGISSATAALLRHALLEDVPLQQGVVLDLGAAGIGHVRLIFRLGNVLADAEAHRTMWSIKGAAGKSPCPCCRNVVADKDVVTDGVHHISTARPHNMMLASAESASRRQTWSRPDGHRRVRGRRSKRFRPQ